MLATPASARTPCSTRSRSEAGGLICEGDAICLLRVAIILDAGLVSMRQATVALDPVASVTIHAISQEGAYVLE